MKCLELRDKLEEEGELDEDEIEEQVDSLRKKLLEELERDDGAGANGGLREGGKGLKGHQVHELAEAKEREMKRMGKALGISPDYEEVCMNWSFAIYNPHGAFIGFNADILM